MAHKLVTDMRIERFQAWHSLLGEDRALSHKMGILAVRDEGTKFKPGVIRNDLSTSRDPDYEAMQAYPDGKEFDYPYEISIQPLTDDDGFRVAPGHYACLLVFDNDVSLGALRPRVDELIAKQRQAAAAEIPPEVRAGAA